MGRLHAQLGCGVLVADAELVDFGFRPAPVLQRLAVAYCFRHCLGYRHILMTPAMTH